MSKNVQELAEELGIDKNELAAMINGMSLGLMGVTGSTILTPMDVERIKKRHQEEKKSPVEPKEEDAGKSSGPVRRRAKAATASDDAVAPVRRRRKKVTAAEDTDSSSPAVRRRAKTLADEEPSAAPGIRARRRVVSAIEPVVPKRRASDSDDEEKTISEALPRRSRITIGEHVEAKGGASMDRPAKKAPLKPASESIEETPADVATPETKSETTQKPLAEAPEVSATVAPEEEAQPIEVKEETPTSEAPDSESKTPETAAKAEEPTPSETPAKKRDAETKREDSAPAKTSSRGSKSSTSRGGGYSAKIVHRPGAKVAKKPQPIDVEPIQQQPRRRTSNAARAQAAQQQAQQPDLAETMAKQVAAPKEPAAPVAPEKQPAATATPPRSSGRRRGGDSTVRAKVKSRPAPAVELEQDDDGTNATTSRRASSRKKEGATIVKKMDKSVVLDRLSAEGKDFTPGPKRGSSSGRRESGRRGGRKRVVEGTDLYGASSRRKTRKTQKAKKKPQKTQITEAAEHKRVIRVENVIMVGDLAHQLGVKAGLLAMKLLEAGMHVTINTMIDYETAAIISEEFNYTVENVAFDIGEFYDTDPDPEETLKPRAPVVTVMGHVDHGKTSLLDAVRSSTVASGEAGGITQHIGAYQVKTDAGEITFLDTPGHEAFTALRARGAKATDLTVLVVAADDGVMPQTMEAINHSQAAGVPIVVAINKIDKPGANVDRIKQALTEYDLVAEEWGGSTLFVEVSAKEHTNIDSLIETIMLQAELQELRANPDRDAQGLVIEAQLDVGRGSVATVLVQRGTLRQGDIIVSGQYYGKVRTMSNERGELVKEAKPSQPVEITGLGGVPEAGEPFFVVQEEKDAKRICQHVIEQRRKEKLAARAREGAVSLEDLSAMIKEGELKELKVILKGDVQGSIEALKQAFSKLGNDEVGVAVIHSGVGGITENDVNLAASSEKGAVIVGFNVRPDNRAQSTAEKYGVKVLTHSIIYDAIEQIRVLLEGMLEPIIEEETIGSAEVREIFSAPKVGTVAGCYVVDGIVKRGAKARVVRDSRVMYDSTIESLRRFKDNVTEVKSGFECGLSIENYNDVKIGDTIECYILKEVAAKL